MQFKTDIRELKFAKRSSGLISRNTDLVFETMSRGIIQDEASPMPPKGEYMVSKTMRPWFLRRPAAIMALAGKTSAQGHHVAAVARAFRPRRGSSNRRWLAHEIGQQPVLPCRPKSANMLEMPDFIGCLQFFSS
jgi:hypothetical protein